MKTKGKNHLSELAVYNQIKDGTLILEWLSYGHLTTLQEALQMFSDDIVYATIRNPGSVLPVQDFPRVSPEANRSDHSAFGLAPSCLASSCLAPCPLRFSLQRLESTI